MIDVGDAHRYAGKAFTFRIAYHAYESAAVDPIAQAHTQLYPIQTWFLSGGADPLSVVPVQQYLFADGEMATKTDKI